MSMELVEHLKVLEDPMREAFPSYENTDWRTLSGTCWREIERLRAELLRVTELEMQIQILEDDLAAAKALLRDVLDQCRETDKMQWDGHLYKRIRAALGEPMTDSERLTAAGYRRRPGRKAIGDDE